MEPLIYSVLSSDRATWEVRVRLWLLVQGIRVSTTDSVLGAEAVAWRAAVLELHIF